MSKKARKQAQPAATSTAPEQQQGQPSKILEAEDRPDVLLRALEQAAQGEDQEVAELAREILEASEGGPVRMPPQRGDASSSSKGKG